MTGEVGRARRSPRSIGLVVICAIAVLLTAVLTALGYWQVQRRAWKLDLIAHVAQRVNAAPQDVPGRASWTAINPTDDVYRRVRAEGVWLDVPDTLVKAVTVRGAGFWAMSPLRTDTGFIILINRGFVPAPDNGGPHAPPLAGKGRATVTGLLRLSEPKGGFLRSNDPAADRWFSRDVAAIAASRGLQDVAPYFIDADAVPGVESPLGGMTVVDFPNNHLVYALTWFALAAMTLGAAIYVVRESRPRSRVNRA